jgi:hypothetical protein
MSETGNSVYCCSSRSAILRHKSTLIPEIEPSGLTYP